MLSKVFDGPSVDVVMMMAARDNRRHHQSELLHRYAPATLVSLTFNIPGPIKTSPLIQAAVHGVVAEIDNTWQDVSVLYREYVDAVTGYEYYQVVQHEAQTIKRCLIEFETQHPLGRLLDLDVVTLMDGVPVPISREQVGALMRTCFICREPAKLCARSRKHSVAELQAYAATALLDYVNKSEINLT